MSPPPPPSLHRSSGGGPVVDLGARAVLAQLGLGFVIATTLGLTVAFVVRRGALVDLRNGEFVSQARADRVDGFVGLGLLAVFVAYVVCAIVFIVWFHRAYRNLAAYRRVNHRTGWAIGAWFVPILNLFRPYQIARELATRSPEPGLDASPGSLRLWWATWVVGVVVTRGASALSESNDIDSLIAGDTVWIGACVLDIVAAVAAIAVVRRVTQAQRALARA